jgi:RNA-dependent RNA polymerase
VIRTYPGAEDYFLRVSFKDETSLQFRFEKEIDGQQFVRDRVGGLAKGHLIIGGRKFFYLGYSMSALKEHAVWFMSPFLHSDGTKVTPESIRSSLGTFTKVLKCPSLYGARMSQAFSATEPSVTVESAELILIDDIERNGSCFTDGMCHVQL